MEYSGSNLKLKLPSFSSLTIILIFLSAVWFQFYGSMWEKGRIIEWDVVSYYSYLPALFVHKDISLSFIDQDPARYSDRFWPSKTDSGKNVIKTTMGLAMVYSPFFFAAHFLAEPLGFDPSGFSQPYRMAISFGALVYLLIGLILLRRILLNHFTDSAVAITLLLVTIGTNLFYYTTIESGMPHIYNFSLFILFIYIIDKWLHKATVRNTLLLGLLYGIISLIRPTNALIGVLFILWGVNNGKLLNERIYLLATRWKYFIIIILVALSVWTPQVIYWHMQTGQLFFNSYINERFFFLSPNILDGLFGFRKGLFVYTPVMIFSVIGFIFLRKYRTGATLPVLIFMILNIYILLSWWSWWYGGSYGNRAFIESYALLSIPLAAFVQWSLERRIKARIGLIIVIGLLLFHSIFQTFQYYYGAIHWDSMTRKAYFDSFGRLKPSADFHNLLSPPDYEFAQLGKAERTQHQLRDAITWNEWNEKSNVVSRNIVVGDNHEFFELYNVIHDDLGANPELNVTLFADNNDIPRDLLLSFSISDSLEKTLYHRDISVRNELVKTEGTERLIWTLPIDFKLNPKSRVKVFFWSQGMKGFTVDSVFVKISGLY